MRPAGKLGSILGKHEELGSVTPVILAGHDHEVFIEVAGKSLIVKVGVDADNIGVVDVWWARDGTLRSSCTLLPASEFTAEPAAAAFVQKQEHFVTGMMECPITTLAMPMTSKRVRFEESGVATMLLQLVKRGLHREGVELAMIQGGAVRGGADYAAGPFTLGDL